MKTRAHYYFDEFSIFIVLVMAIWISRFVGSRRRNSNPYDWIHVAEAVVVAFSAYGGLHTKWRMSDKQKPSWLKRAGIAVAYGISADTVAGWIR